MSPEFPPPGCTVVGAAEEEGPELVGWGEKELASEFWTEDKSYAQGFG